jgi:hypothetical protein
MHACSGWPTPGGPHRGHGRLPASSGVLQPRPEPVRAGQPPKGPSRDIKYSCTVALWPAAATLSDIEVTSPLTLHILLICSSQPERGS